MRMTILPNLIFNHINYIYISYNLNDDIFDGDMSAFIIDIIDICQANQLRC